MRYLTSARAACGHSVCRLLQAAVKKSGWDMELKLPGAEPQASEERAGRTLN